MEPTVKEVCQSLNELLQGCHMGAQVYQEYLASAKDPMLKRILVRSLDVFKKHEIELTKRINERQTDATDSIPIMAAVGSFFEKMKAVMADDDKKILDECIRALGMGLNACQTFKEKYPNLEETLMNAVNDLERDYKILYAEMTSLKLN